MEVYQLRYFQAVATKGSYSAAAAYIHVSQPSLSIQIRRLEDELGRRLFWRTARGATLTPAGARFLETVNLVLNQLREVRHDLREAEPHPIIRMGVQPLLAPTILPPLLRDYLAAHPSTRIAVQEHPNYLLPEPLMRGEAQFCLMTRLDRYPSNQAITPLFSYPYGLFSRQPDVFKKHRLWGLRQIVSQPLLVFRDPSRMEERIRQMAMQIRQEPRILFMSDYALTVLEMCGGGLGMAVLPMLVREPARRLGLHCRPLALSGIRSQIVVVHRDNHPIGGPAQQFMQFLVERLKREKF